MYFTGNAEIEGRSKFRIKTNERKEKQNEMKLGKKESVDTFAIYTFLSFGHKIWDTQYVAPWSFSTLETYVLLTVRICRTAELYVSEFFFTN